MTTVADIILTATTDAPTETPAEASTGVLPGGPEHLSADEALRRGIIHTEISPGLARWMVAIFVAMFVSVPIIQSAYEIVTRSHPQELDVFKRVPTKANLKGYEDDLRGASVARKFVQPLIQELVSARGGFGNTNAVVGRDGWLFYRPGVDYLFGRGILDSDRLRARKQELLSDGQADPHPDPREAIKQFSEQCKAAGAHLVIVPIPDKAMLQPGQLTRRLDERRNLAPPNNVDFAKLVSGLRAAGVDVFDPTPAEISAYDRRFLIQDTHWTPDWMEHVATDLAAHVSSAVPLPSRPAYRLRAVPTQATRVGDLVDMLRLPEDQRAFPPQTVTINPVVDAKRNEPWQPRGDADVLLLGDSFTNIYSAAGMGWGESAGFAEQLSRALHRPLDRISRNDAGAYATRQMLGSYLARGKNRLAGKKVVIWEFADRELAVGNWKLIEMKLGTPPPSQFIVPPAGKEMVVTGVIESIARPPRPHTVPYTEHIVAMHLVDISGPSGPIPGGEALVYVWSMRNNTLTAAARYGADQKITLRLRPWSDVSGKLESINRRDLDDEQLNLQEPCWGEEIQP
jgi:alginate O-acetyltransferase complex protein AlgJ